MKTLNKQLGSILIEALIALVVLGLGIVAIAKLQGSLVKGGAESQARNVALQLAQQKIDDLRAYNQPSAPPGATWSTTTQSPTIRPYDWIQTNTGGGALWPPNSRATVGNTVYDVAWNVVDYPTSFYKAVTMTVSWTPPGGSVEHANLTSYIAKLDGYGEKLLGGGLAASPGPQVIYNPGAAPDVIAIDTGGESTETTLPEPAIKKIASTDYFYSQFETVTYTGGSNVEEREEEFLNIRCECDYATGGNHIGLGFPVARSIWHPSHENDVEEHAHYVASFFHPQIIDHAFIAQTESGRADFLGEMITKVVGKSAQGASSQHPFCNICCRDHHDGDQEFLAAQNDPTPPKTDDDITGAYACKPDTDFAAAGNAEGDRSKCVDPWRPTADYDSSTGDHKHYTAAGTVVNPGGNGTYLEACRLKRINGKFNVFQDWHLHGSTYVAAAEDAFDPDATGNKFDEYREYIKDYVKAVITNHDNLPVTNIVNPATSFVWPPSGNATYPITKQFIARGIYMDYLDSYTLDRLYEIVNTTTFFENAPFNEINLTRLTDWQPECVTSGGATASTLTFYRKINLTPTSNKSCVTNYGLAANKAQSPDEIKRGLVGLYSSSDTFTFAANILLSNTGLIGINDFLPEPTLSTSDDRSYDSAFALYSRNFGTPPGVARNITITGPSSGWNTNNSIMLVSATNGAQVTGTPGSNGWNSSLTYSATSWTGTITVTGTKGASSCSGSTTTTLTGTTGTVTIACN